MKTIILTGGGTAGHVTPNLALIPSLKEAGYEIRYIGSYNGIERKLIENAGIPYDVFLPESCAVISILKTFPILSAS